MVIFMVLEWVCRCSEMFFDTVCFFGLLVSDCLFNSPFLEVGFVTEQKDSTLESRALKETRGTEGSAMRCDIFLITFGHLRLPDPWFDNPRHVEKDLKRYAIR